MNANRLQLHVLSSHVSFGSTYDIAGLRSHKKYVSLCNIDKFFEQPQNLTPYGWQDESPIAASSPSAEKHVTMVNAERQSSKMSVDDLMETTVSRSCQTLAEVSALAKSLHKPLPSEYEDEKDVVVDSTVSPSSSSE